MSLKWTDVLDIAIALDESRPDIDPMTVNFVDLRNWIMDLPEFDDDPAHCGERILEAVQQAWIEERD
ncbi:MAG: Fe-S cluster assembly protein IscX [Gammaproteobacteria bacterium]|nr:Fe-S cluster assembly protein IscX [Gammaproteobacteria bacterium]MCP5410008.1 Fe-S cluster assembly protein IscX [Chromatiaceae bacterium]MCP5443221.1 Fe-S cluster assembly protein IscX [Chromatiaceae bacterium]